MNAKNTVEFLRRYNAWRRGDDSTMPSPVEIGKAIDDAISLINQRDELIAAAPTPPATSDTWEAAWFANVECTLAEGCYVAGDLAESLRNLANRASKSTASETVSELVKALRLALPCVVRDMKAAVKENFGRVDDDPWANQAVDARDAVEAAIAKHGGAEC